MVYEFNHIEVVVESPRILASFTTEQIRLITKFANESNFFVDGIDEETMDGFFKCALDESLVVVNMRQVLAVCFVYREDDSPQLGITYCGQSAAHP